MAVHVKRWSMLLRKCFDGSELLVGLTRSFHLTFALQFVLQM